MRILLRSPEDTRLLGRLLADALRHPDAPRAVLLRGDLGAGKTALTRAAAEALPGGEHAEISSPSFTVCNRYPTTPRMLHCDLYRCGGEVPDEILDALDAGRDLVFVEWAERLPERDLPRDVLDIRWKMCETGRLVTLRAGGGAAETALGRLSAAWERAHAEAARSAVEPQTP